MATFFSWAILVTGAISLLYFIYYGIILPTIRLRLRFAYFELRDRLRDFHDEVCAADRQAYAYMQDSLNSCIMYLYKIDIGTIIQAERWLARNPEIRQQSETRSKVLLECPSEELRSIHNRAVLLTLRVVLVNSGGLIPFIAAVAAVLYACRKIKQCGGWIRRNIDRTLFLPPSAGEHDGGPISALG